MEKTESRSPIRDPRFPALRFVLAAFAAFFVANLLHNNFGIDPAIIPAGILTGLSLRRPHPVLLAAAAVVIAVPAFAFLKWRALTDPSSAHPFLNHLFLLAAGVLALVALATVGLGSARRFRPSR